MNIPTKSNSLTRLRQYIEISEIVDIGVNEWTPELVSVFPDAKHYLFEPVLSFHSNIKENYKNIEYELYDYALADKNGIMYLITSSVESDGNVTHSQISDKNVLVDGSRYIDCTEIPVKRFDTLQLAITSGYLLKIDVDGKEKEVLSGFGERLRNASVIVLEATFSTLLERLEYCSQRGFQLWDIVDLVYYGPCLYQCDLVLVNNNILNNEIRPPIIDFRREYWQPLKI